MRPTLRKCVGHPSILRLAAQSTGAAASALDRAERSEREPSQDRHYGAPPRASSARHSPHRTGKKRAACDHDEPPPHPPPPPPSAAELAKLDRKQKASVFSRISFPGANPESSPAALAPADGGGGGGGGSGPSRKKRRSSSELPPPPKKNGLVKEDREPGENRTASDSYRSPAAAAPAARRGYEHESSEEEYHFKRRPSRREADSWDVMDDGRHSRGSREREPHSERPTSKRR